MNVFQLKDGASSTRAVPPPDSLKFDLLFLFPSLDIVYLGQSRPRAGVAAEADKTRDFHQNRAHGFRTESLATWASNKKISKNKSDNRIYGANINFFIVARMFPVLARQGLGDVTC